MTTFTYSSTGVASYGSQPSIDAYTKSFDSTASNRIGELQNFLLASDWSSLSSLSPPTATIQASADEAIVWSSTSTMSEAPLFPSSVETVRPLIQSTAVATPAPAFDASSTNTIPTPVAAPAVYLPESMTPPHRQSLDTCYSDSVGSPDSERDFLTSPSMFDDADFEFDADTLANNFPLFGGDHSYEDASDANTDDSVNAFASSFENVKLESTDAPESQQTEMDLGARQSTVMPSQSQVKTEDDPYDSPSTLEASFKSEADLTKLEPKDEQDLWSANGLQPYFNDEEAKAAVLSTLANAFGPSFAEPVKQGVPTTPASESIHYQDDHHQQTSKVGPVRSSRASRERRSSPTKASNTPSASDSLEPFIDSVTKVKSWQCTECGKWFDRAYNLKTHRYTHEDPETRARPFVCPEIDCQKQFARKHDMQRHFENVHRGESRRAKSVSNKRSRADDLG